MIIYHFNTKSHLNSHISKDLEKIHRITLKTDQLRSGIQHIFNKSIRIKCINISKKNSNTEFYMYI